MSRNRLPAGAATSLRGPPELRVSNHDRMRRDVTIELARGREVIAVEHASLHRGSSRSWRNVFGDPGEYRATVSLRYGASETVAWTATSPGGLALDVLILPGAVRTYPGSGQS